MNEQKQTQSEKNEISLVDIILFLKASSGNIVKSTLVFLLASGTYYLFAPEKHEATATIDMAMVAGEQVETPLVLLEKMKLPLYFSPATLQACDAVGGPNSQHNLVDKIKSTLVNKSFMVSFAVHAPSSTVAKDCLNAVIAEVVSYQDAIAKPILSIKKQKLQELGDRLKILKEIENSFMLKKYKYENKVTDALFIYLATNSKEVHNLQSEIRNLEYLLTAPQTRPVSIVSPVYAYRAPFNKLPLFNLQLCLALGVFLGLFVTGVMRIVPELQRQMRERENEASTQ